VPEVHQRASRCDLLVDAGRVGGDVDGAGGDADQEQRDAERDRRAGQRGQKTGHAEQPHRNRKHRAAAAVDELAGQAHREQRAEPDHQQRQAQLRIGGRRRGLHGGHERSPAAPEGAECGERGQRAAPAGAWMRGGHRWKCSEPRSERK
jgi:hypothetical protein